MQNYTFSVNRNPYGRGNFRIKTTPALVVQALCEKANTAERLFLIVFKPLLTAHVGKVFNLELLENGLETVAVGACCHEADLDGSIVLHPCVAHHDVVLVVERIENLDGVQAAYGLNPDVGYGLVEADDTPVGSVVGDNSAQVVFAVYEFNARLDIVFVVDKCFSSS